MRILKCIIYFSVLECSYLTFKNDLHFCNDFRELELYTSKLSALLILTLLCYWLQRDFFERVWRAVSLYISFGSIAYLNTKVRRNFLSVLSKTLKGIVCQWKKSLMNCGNFFVIKIFNDYYKNKCLNFIFWSLRALIFWVTGEKERTWVVLIAKLCGENSPKYECMFKCVLNFLISYR